MTIQKTTKIIDHYETKCKRCNKIITGVSIKATRHNYKIHQLFCKEKGEK